MKHLLAPRFWTMVLLPAIAFALLSMGTEDRALILVLNIVQVAVAIAVVTAFLPEMVRVVFGQAPMTRASWLAYGIWLAWFAVVYRTAESLFWRLMGQPSWLINSDFTSAYLYMGIIAATAHVIKPGGLEDRVPPKEWVRVGAIIGASVALALGLLYARDIAAAWTGHHDFQQRLHVDFEPGHRVM